jgi:hypothetical protein
MASKGFPFMANTVNGLIVDDPVTVIMKCDRVRAVGPHVVKAFDPDYNIVAIKVFLVEFNGDVYGTTEIEDLEGYREYINGECQCCEDLCFLTIGGCLATINGCLVPFESNSVPCQLFIAGCAATINGCTLSFSSKN